MKALFFLGSLIIASAQLNPIYNSASYRSEVRSSTNGKLFQVSVPNTLPFWEMHTFGNPYDRGYAHGDLLHDTILQFVNVDLPNFYRSEVDQIPLGRLPQWLQDFIKKEGKKAAPKVFEAALGYVWSKQVSFINASKAGILDELEGMAAGVCSNYNSTACDKDKLTTTLQNVNMLPELIQMQCSMMGAWGAGTPDSKLVQLRTLDFGTGPFANHTILSISHPSNAPAFANIGFPAFAGAVTGFSEKIGLCEKVDDVTASNRPKGTYNGQAASMVIRDILEFAGNKEEAVEIAMKAHRTWSMWLGFGDFESQEFLSVLYDEESVIPLTDETLPFFTNQSRFKDVAYIDKHPQPSVHPTLPQLVKDYYGKLSVQQVIQNIPRLTQSGDVHIGAYDFGSSKAYIARGIVDANGDFITYAYQAPFIEFDMAALWSQKP